MTVGMLLVSAQLFYFSRLDENAVYVDLLPAFLVGGIGMALVMTPSAAAAVRALPVDKSGVGSAVLNAFRQVGGSMGIALMGAIMAHQIGGLKGPEVFRQPERFVDGFSTSLLVAAVIALAGAVISFALVRPHELDEPDRRAEPVPEVG